MNEDNFLKKTISNTKNPAQNRNEALHRIKTKNFRFEDSIHTANFIIGYCTSYFDFTIIPIGVFHCRKTIKKCEK
jgi:hypothetical protein